MRTLAALCLSMCVLVACGGSSDAPVDAAPGLCGDGVVGPGETCDIAVPCPASCDDGNACTVDTRSGSVTTCDVTCTYAPVTACASGDGCCPAGCTNGNDNDCSATCGNGTVESSETCDPMTSCPTSCDDQLACTTDLLTGSAANCNVMCSHGNVIACSSGDGCCPPGCTSANDGDCSASCGNGAVTPPEECDPPNGVSCDATCHRIPEIARCSDGQDNDLDALIDCADPDCASASVCVVAGTQLAAGIGLTLQDVSDSGAFVAYTNGARMLFVVPTAGGAPTPIAANVDKARYKGRFLVTYEAIDATGKIAGTMRVYPEGGTTATITGSLVKIGSVIASADGNHIYYAQKTAVAALTENLYRDGTLVLGAVNSSRARFSPTNNYLVIAAWLDDPQAGMVVQQVAAYPLAGGAARVLVADGGAMRFDIAPDGNSVVVGTNQSAATADLVRVPIGGGTGVPLATAASDRGFHVLEDGVTLAYLNPAASSAALAIVHLDGTSRTTLVPSGVTDIEATSAQVIVYVTTVNPTTGLPTYRMIGKTGTGDIALGSEARSEGFTPDEAYFGFRDQIVGSTGRLQRVDVAARTAAQLAAAATKASFASSRRMLYRDDGAVLRLANLATSTSTILEDNVAKFIKVHDAFGSTTSSRVVFLIPGGSVAGIYIAPVPL